jgi:hypothetical protein
MMDLDRFVRAQQTWDRAFACNIARALEADDPPVVIGIIGRGHIEYGYGTPWQLADLGVSDVMVLLPTDSDYDPASEAGIADALFRLPNAANTGRKKTEGPDFRPGPDYFSSWVVSSTRSCSRSSSSLR